MRGYDPVGETARVASIYERQAPSYDRRAGTLEWVLDGGRSWACQQAFGSVLEIGIGTGLSLAHYPSRVRLTGVDISPRMIEQARRRAAMLGLTADLRVADAQHLPFADASFDTVTVIGSLCSIPDDAVALREAYRVLRPDGRLLAAEHARSPHVLPRAAERAFEGWSVRSSGDHLLREPERAAAAAGFTIEHLERHRLGLAVWLAARR